MRDKLDRVVDELRVVVVSDFAMIEEINAYLLNVPGKLIRPTLVLLASEVGGEPSDDAVTLAAVVELVHMATLVHDDAVDHSVMRRGMPTINSVWTHQIAIIMGDYLYSRSVTELARLGNLDALRVLASAANEMSVGEMRQLLSYDDIDYSETEYLRLISAKTASLMAAAGEMGSLGGNPAYRQELRRLGHNLGMAFQIVDDMLDYVGRSDIMGKPAGLDLRCRKVTLPLIGALKRMSPADVAKVRHLFEGGEPGNGLVQEVVELVRCSGGIEYARRRVAEYATEARGAIASLAPGPATDALCRLVAHVSDRSW